jgi:hypothetical protein
MDELMSTAGCTDVSSRGCLTKIAQTAGLSRFIWGALTLKRGRVAVQLALFNVDSAGTTAQLDYSSNMIDTFDENLLRLANNGLARLLGPIHYPVQIRSRQSKGTVVIDDVVTGTLESGVAEIAVTAGDHRFRLVLPDATAIARTFQVLVNARNHLRLEFMDIPES